MAARSGEIQTVNGPVSPNDVGVSLMHEHIFIDFIKFYKAPEGDDAALGDAKIELSNVHWVQYHVCRNKHNLTLEDENDAVAELSLFKKAGGSLVVDATTHGIGRDPLRAQSVAKQTGVHVVAGAGFYVGATQTQDVLNMTAKELEELMVKEVEEGIGSTDVRAGLIGEIGTSWPIAEGEVRVLQAAARAAKRTGTMLNIHPGRHEAAPLECIRIVREAAGPEILQRTVMSHIDRTLFDTRQHLEIAKTGVVLEFDLFGMEVSKYPFAHHKKSVCMIMFAFSLFAHTQRLDMPNDGQRIEWITALLKEGYEKQLLLSHDIYTKHRLHKYGGHGYDHISRNIIPRLREHDVSEAQIEQMLISTPRRLLTKL